jgi:3-phosphoshikimate 1-carboxyvinyltransferase
MEEPLELTLRGVIRSAPYIDLTIAVMRRAGARVERSEARLRVDPGFASPGEELAAPVDWSGAVPMLASAAFLGRPAFVPGLALRSPHPDAAFATIADALGLELVEKDGGVEARGAIRRGGAFDLGGAPDLAPTLAVLGAMAPGGVTVGNAPQLRLKESDRIGDLVAMLEAAGIPAAARPDGFEVPGCWAEERPDAETAVPLDPHGDHRLAMAAALIGLVRPVVIEDAEVVAKSFPTFFEVFPAGGRWRHGGDAGRGWLT